MKFLATCRRSLPAAIALSLAISIAGCGSKEPPATSTTAAPPPAPEAAPAATPAAAPAAASQGVAPTAAVSLSPEALEELLAPIALYPDPILSQVLIASTNPQEVLDAGNWLLQNQNLSGNALDEAAAQIGFTPPIRSLIQFPETVDMMCMQLDWTTELGQAFVADQQGVLDAVQRLRRQAVDVGNLQTSAQMKVENQVQEGKEVVVLAPADPEVIYVPQYDPVAVYEPAPAAAAPAAAPAATTTTTTTESTGHSTGALVTTGLLAFGAGMLVNEIFDDDDDHHHNNDYYYPNYGYGGMPYYPPYPYRPAYGNGYYPANGYNRPPNYQHGFNNNNVVVINNGQNDYWNDRDNRRNEYQRSGTYQAKSPISQAKPNRPELQELNQRQPRAMPADVKRPSTAAAPKQWKGQSSYAGAQKGGQNKQVAANAAQARPTPKAQGSYGGASGDRAKPASSSYQGANKAKPPSPKPSTKDVSKPRPGSGQGDRGYSKPESAPAARPQKMDAAKPAARPAQSPARSGSGQKPQKTSAMSGAGQGGKADRAASQRGKQSMPQGARSKGGGGGGGGKKGKR